MRLPAREIEALVTAKIATLFDDMLGLIDMAGLDVDPRRLPMLEHRGREIAARVSGRDRELIRASLLEAGCRRGGCSCTAAVMK
jgi:hypothetical protein